MAERSSGSGARLILALGALLLVAIVVVLWLATRPEPAPVAPPQPAPDRSAEPVAPPRPARPRELEPATVVPKVRPAPVEVPSEPEELDTVQLDVEVFAANGSPAAGATVMLLDPFAQHAGPLRAAQTARAQADDAGHAKFEASKRTVRVFAWLANEAGASDKFQVSDAKSHVAVRLTPAVAVHGRVVETTGRPVADADVRFLARAWFDDPFGLLLETKSGADGVFDLPALPLGAFEGAAADTFAIEAAAKGWPASRVSVTSDTLRAGDVVVTLERGAFLRGRLVRPTGEPVHAEEIRLADGRSVVTSDPEGRFELPLPRGGGIAIARTTRGLGGRSGFARPMDFGWGAPKLLGRFRADAGDIDLGDVTLSAGQPVKGQVVDGSNNPLKAADVVLGLAGVQVAATQTDDAGKFEFDAVGDDPHVLQATEAPAENAWSGRRHAAADGVRGGATDLRVVITGALTVLVKFQAEADRSPVVVPQVTLRATATGATPAAYGWSWAGARIDQVRFEVEHAGTYDVTVELPGYEPATASAVEVSPDREMLIDVLFRKLP